MTADGCDRPAVLASPAVGWQSVEEKVSGPFPVSFNGGYMTVNPVAESPMEIPHTSARNQSKIPNPISLCICIVNLQIMDRCRIPKISEILFLTTGTEFGNYAIHDNRQLLRLF